MVNNFRCDQIIDLIEQEMEEFWVLTLHFVQGNLVVNFEWVGAGLGTNAN
jgi:hypothetical protein